MSCDCFRPSTATIAICRILGAELKQPFYKRNLRLYLEFLMVTPSPERNHIILNPVETLTGPYSLHIYYNKFFVKNQEKILDVRHHPGLLCAR